MGVEEKNLFSAFNRGVKRIICKHSPGKVQTENTSPGIHQHREILFILRGKSTFPLNHKIFDIKAGDVVLIDHWISHRVWYLPTDRNTCYLWFYLFRTHLNLLVHQIDDKGNFSPVFEWIELSTDLKMLIDRHWDEFNKLSPAKALDNLECFFKLPLQMLLDEFRFYIQLNKLKEEKTQTNNEILNSVRRIIEANNGRDCSLAKLEKYTGFSRFYISHLFKDTYGISIGEYINRVRLLFFESAQKQGFNNKQIAYELGFSSNSALLMWYRKAKEKIL